MNFQDRCPFGLITVWITISKYAGSESRTVQWKRSHAVAEVPIILPVALSSPSGKLGRLLNS